MTTEEETYTLTPKGFLEAKTGNAELWDELQEFVLRQAREKGGEGNLPALIFDAGGVCLTANPLPKPSELASE